MDGVVDIAGVTVVGCRLPERAVLRVPELLAEPDVDIAQ